MTALGKTAELLADARADWRPELTRSDTEALLGRKEWPSDPRRITVGRIFYVDLPAAVARYAKGFTKDERESLRTDALLWITERSEHGEKRFPLGAPGLLPLRRDWLDDGRPSAGAWRAMHAALKAAADAPRRIGRAPENELPMEGQTLGLLAEREKREEEEEERTAVILDADAFELARVLGLPENAARALLASAFNLSLDECSREWNITRESASVAISKGKKVLASRYPEPYDLLDALRAGVIALGAIREDAARQTILEWKRAPRDAFAQDEALKAAREWRSGKHALPPARAALISALVRTLSRTESDSETVAERAGRIADGICRLLSAERKRAYDATRKGTRAGIRGSVDMAEDAPLPPDTRVWPSGQDRDERALASERLAARAEDRAIVNARRAYFRAHAADWEAGSDLLAWYGDVSSSATPRANVPAPMYETEAWSKGIKL